ncbi:MAG TPA: RNA polymerase sigma factor, partial [Gammaproteobacteria bacterium]
DRLYGYAVHLAGGSDDARELVQVCALKALAARNIPGDERAYRSWLFRILRNSWFDECRRRRRQPLSWDSLEKAKDTPGNETWLPDVSTVEKRLFNRLAVREGLARLGAEHREVLVLVDMAGFSYQDTAELLEVPIGTVMSRVSRARRRLLQALEEPAVRPLRLRLVGRS